jgi:glycosyltransferase involved in cell wall biosynthesis
MPVYNERESIEDVIKEWSKEAKRLNVLCQLIICEDGSTDGTTAFLPKIKSKYHLTLNQVKRRRGYGGAVIDGIKSAKYPDVFCTDSDGQCSPKDLKKFLSKENNGVLIGWRVRRADSPIRFVYSTSFKFLFRLLFPESKIHDPSAPYVLFKKEMILKIEKDLHYLKEGFWWGFVGACVKRHIPVNEIPITHLKRMKGNTNVYQMKKIAGIAWRNALGLLQLRMAP